MPPGSAFAFGALLALSACESVDGAVKKEGPAAKATLAKAAEVATDLRARPPVRTDDVVKPEGERLRIAEDDDTANTDLVYLEDLKTPGELGNVYARLRGSDTLGVCAAYAAHGTPPWDARDPNRWSGAVFAGEVTRQLQYCGKLKALFVLRTMEFVRPANARLELRPPTPTETGLDAGASADGGARGDAGVRPGTKPVVVVKPRALADAGAPRDAGTPQDAGPSPFVLPPRGNIVPATVSGCRDDMYRCVYDGGYLRVEVHVYGIDPVVKHRGAFVVEAESSGAVDLDTTDVESALEDDLRKQLKRAFRAAVLQNAGETWIGGFE